MVNNMERRRNDMGVKLLNELMVDIIGAVIPGFLFIIVIFLSIVLPSIIYIETTSNDVINFSSLFKSSGFWWVLFLVCIIFSYVIGHIFYRADISLPDKLDVDRQVKEFVENTKKKEYNIEQIKTLLKREINVLRERLQRLEGEQWTEFKNVLLNACEGAIDDLEHNNNLHDYNENILTILFPEDALHLNKNRLSKKDLSENSLEVIDCYEKYFYSTDDIDTYFLNEQCLIICYCILHCQVEMACDYKGRCDFPYINYYKYLLRRNLTDLVKHIDWATSEERSKNKINSLKIRVQIFANEAYAMINKNESHIRMSSSTWHITKQLIYVTIASFIGFLSLIIRRLICNCEIITAQWFAMLLPLIMFILVFYIRYKIPRYIHYQRLREIQYTLQIYDQYKDIIEFRKKYRANNNQESEKQ